MQKITTEWLKITLVNLCIVALLGVTMRYKIAFSLPFIDQKNLMHGHSHFAFSGWVTQALMILLLNYLHRIEQETVFKKYKWILFSNLFISYGMLISFAIQGYAFFSILFSTLSVFVSYVFVIKFWKDLNALTINRNIHLWLKAALFFNAISSLGPFCLAYMLSSHILIQKVYLASVLYFLHFQYNGWFLFACIGLFISKLGEEAREKKSFKNIFWIFTLSCPPCYFLSALWLPINMAVYLTVVIAALMQLIAWIWFAKIACKQIPILKNKMSNMTTWLIALAAISFSIKLLLQLGSAYPPLSQLVFGFRPIVVGYLHLVLLAITSIFILGYTLSEKLLTINRPMTIGVVIFVLGVFTNEILLMIQGIFALATINIFHINILLFFAAIVIFTGVLLINIGQFLPAIKNESVE